MLYNVFKTQRQYLLHTRRMQAEEPIVNRPMAIRCRVPYKYQDQDLAPEKPQLRLHIGYS